VEAFYSWYLEKKPVLIEAQKAVTDGEICGKLDYVVSIEESGITIDLKCTANAEKSWPLQLGGYSALYPTDQCGVLHLNPKFAKGWIWRPYDPMIARSQWRAAYEWYKCLKSMKIDV
jgi:hypothetical protein